MIDDDDDVEDDPLDWSMVQRKPFSGPMARAIAAQDNKRPADLILPDIGLSVAGKTESVRRTR